MSNYMHNDWSKTMPMTRRVTLPLPPADATPVKPGHRGDGALLGLAVMFVSACAVVALMLVALS